MEDYGKIKKLHDSLQKKEFSCEELTKTYIGAIEADNPALNAYVHFTPETALAAAQEVDAKIARGEMLDILEGIPMTLKDNISTTGIETTCAPRFWRATARYSTPPYGSCFAAGAPFFSAKPTWMNSPWAPRMKPRFTAARGTPTTPLT